MEQIKRTRLAGLDTIRGITLISMILYHGVWDLVHLYDVPWDWYNGTFAYIWQQSICWTFILLSGFCWSLGKHPFRRGLLIFGCGALVSAITLLVMPSSKILFGILTLIGSCVLLMIPLDRLLKKMSPILGIIINSTLFVITKNCKDGYLGFEGWEIVDLPNGLYRNLLTTYFGFPSGDFWSMDYFPLFPWIFLFLTGYFLFRILNENALNEKLFSRGHIPVVGFMGMYSLIIYMVHQPILYALFEIVNVVPLFQTL